MAIKTFVNGDFVSYTDINTYGANNHMKMLYESTQTAPLVWTGSVFTSEFENYYISITSATCTTANQTLRYRLTFGGTPANQIGTNEYNSAQQYIGSDTGSGLSGSVNQAFGTLGELSIVPSSPSAFQMMVYRPALSTGKGVSCRSIGPVGAVTRNYNIATAINTTTVCDALLFYNLNTYTNTMTVRVYGLRQT